MAKAKRERERKLAEAERRKALAEQRRREDAARLTRVAAEASGDIRKATTTLGEVVREAAETRQNLLRQDWQPADPD